MTNINVDMDEKEFWNFKKLMTILKCGTNRETIIRMMSITQDYLQQHSTPSENNNRKSISANPSQNHHHKTTTKKSSS